MAEADAEESAAAYSGLAQFDAAHYESYAAEAQREAARAAADLDDLVSPPRSDEDIVARAIAPPRPGSTTPPLPASPPPALTRSS